MDVVLAFLLLRQPFFLLHSLALCPISSHHSNFPLNPPFLPFALLFVLSLQFRCPSDVVDVSILFYHLRLALRGQPTWLWAGLVTFICAYVLCPSAFSLNLYDGILGRLVQHGSFCDFLVFPDLGFPSFQCWQQILDVGYFRRSHGSRRRANLVHLRFWIESVLHLSPRCECGSSHLIIHTCHSHIVSFSQSVHVDQV